MYRETNCYFQISYLFKHRLFYVSELIKSNVVVVLLSAVSERERETRERTERERQRDMNLVGANNTYGVLCCGLILKNTSYFSHNMSNFIFTGHLKEYAHFTSSVLIISIYLLKYLTT